MRKYTILIVDDEENVARLLSKVFAKEGFVTYTAADANAALALIERHHVDILLTDIKMPEISGIELLKKVKKIDSSIKVVLMTAFATLDTAIEALKMGARDYITKPFNLEDVLDSINKILGNSEEESVNIEMQETPEIVDRFLISKSQKMRGVLELIRQVADSRATIMLYGETGTGKELAAQVIHDLSERQGKPFIKVNCAAIPDTLMESELFGFEKGAFTGAIAKKPGRFELADGGSIFLDEIGDISPAMQVKLLRVLQEREFQPLGSIKTLKVDVRIIGATNKNLEEMVKNNLFREDLFYRLNVVPIHLPPLRERQEDIAGLVDYFLSKSADITGKFQKQIDKEAINILTQYDWPGNIRELENIIERSVVVTTGDVIRAKDLPNYLIQSERFLRENSHTEISKKSGILDDVVDNAERDVIIQALHAHNGNRTRASEHLGISRRSLHRKIVKYNIED